MGISSKVNWWNRYKRAIQLCLGVLIALFILISEVKAQNTDGFIYGKVTTLDNAYEGQIRWGKEEAFWTDLFNGAKLYKSVENEVASKADDKDSWVSFDWRLSSIWDDRKNIPEHQFTIRFGDIQSIEIISRYVVNLTLKNGVTLKVGGEGYNDLTSDIAVIDKELGAIAIDWDRIRKIEFKDTPSRLKPTFGKPLYGTVETVRKGSMKGFVQWDHDERLSPDKLDGRSSDGKVSIAFDNIQKIEKASNSSVVYLKSGRNYQLAGSNDVSEGNRGIIITIDEIGKVEVPWRAFKTVEFEEVKNSGDSYSSYIKPERLYGTVSRYEGKEVKGQIIYDLDETWDVEMLEGKDDEIEYHIPFRNIRRITPKNYNYSNVELRNGSVLLLGGVRDVSDANDGLLVIVKGEKQPVYVRWRDITEITFD